jgi:tol-pal system protein YbgF
MPFHSFRNFCVALLAFNVLSFAQAGLFDDDEARKAILELRQKLESSEKKQAEVNQRQAEETSQLRRSLLELQNLIETLKADMARQTGQMEQLTRALTDQQRPVAELQRQVAELQRQQKDATQVVDERLRKFEPIKVAVDGKEFLAEPNEKRDFDAALAVFRKGEFAAAQTAFVDFLKRNPQSGYGPSSLFWLGNAQYATRDYKEAITNFRSLLAQAADHMRAPEAVLSIANCQIELKDTRAARKTLEDLIKAYPQSEAAVAGKERLARLK